MLSWGQPWNHTRCPFSSLLALGEPFSSGLCPCLRFLILGVCSRDDKAKSSSSSCVTSPILAHEHFLFRCGLARPSTPETSLESSTLQMGCLLRVCVYPHPHLHIQKCIALYFLCPFPSLPYVSLDFLDLTHVHNKWNYVKIEIFILAVAGAHLNSLSQISNRSNRLATTLIYSVLLQQNP